MRPACVRAGGELQQVVRFLRQEKEVATVELRLAQHELARLRSDLAIAQRAVLEANAQVCLLRHGCLNMQELPCVPSWIPTCWGVCNVFSVVLRQALAAKDEHNHVGRQELRSHVACRPCAVNAKIIPLWEVVLGGCFAHPDHTHVYLWSTCSWARRPSARAGAPRLSRSTWRSWRRWTSSTCCARAMPLCGASLGSQKRRPAGQRYLSCHMYALYPGA